MSYPRVLAITNLFPSNTDPNYAPFNRLQFAALGRMTQVDVLNVVPWRFGRYYGGRTSADVVAFETIDGLAVSHPRFPAIPGLPGLNASLIVASLFPEVARRRLKRSFDVILAAYAYPDGCAGVMLGQMLKVPVVVKCHGSDLNRVVDDLPARRQLESLLPRAQAVVAVSKRLSEKAIELGVEASKLHVIYNGVDRERFRVDDRMEARARLKYPQARELIVCVGHLAEHKGTRDLLEAARLLHQRRPQAMVAFIGDGPLAPEVHNAAEAISETGVLAVGRVAHDEVAEWMTAADVICLPSWDEGMPNVVREAHASGRPVVATSVGGVPEAVHCHELGRLVPAKDPQALASALEDLLASPRVDPQVIVQRGLVQSWEESAKQLLDVLASVSRTSAQGKS